MQPGSQNVNLVILTLNGGTYRKFVEELSFEI